MAKKKSYRRKTGKSTGILSTTMLAGAAIDVAVGHTYNLPYEFEQAFKGNQSAGDALAKTGVALKEGLPSLVVGIGTPLLVKGVMRLFGITNPTLFTMKGGRRIKAV